MKANTELHSETFERLKRNFEDALLRMQGTPRLRELYSSTMREERLGRDKADIFYRLAFKDMDAGGGAYVEDQPLKTSPRALYDALGVQERTEFMDYWFRRVEKLGEFGLAASAAWSNGPKPVA